MSCGVQKIDGRTYAVCPKQVDGRFNADEGWTIARDATGDTGIIMDVEPLSIFLGYEGAAESDGKRTRYGIVTGLFSFNPNKNLVGINASIFSGIGGDLSGVQLGLVNNVEGDVNGAQISILGNMSNGDVNGAQVSVVVNMAQNLKGAQLAWMGNVVENEANGVQVAAMFDGAGSMHGIQLAGGMCKSEDEMYGLQACAGGSMGGDVHGAQVGFMNLCEDELAGVQLGVITTTLLGIGVGAGMGTECTKIPKRASDAPSTLVGQPSVWDEPRCD